MVLVILVIFGNFYTFLRYGAWCSRRWGSSWLWCFSEECHTWVYASYSFVCCPHNYRFSIVIMTCAIKSDRDIFHNINNVISAVPKLNGVLHWTCTCVKGLPLNTTSTITSISVFISEKIINFNFSWND